METEAEATAAPNIMKTWFSRQCFTGLGSQARFFLLNRLSGSAAVKVLPDGLT